MRVFAIALAGLISFSSNADVIVPIASKHLATNGYDFNELNLGIGYESESFGFVGYKNSFNELSIAAYGKAKLIECDIFDVGVNVGLSTGYYDRPLTLTSSIYIETEHVFVNVIPSFLVSDKTEPDHSGLVVTFGIRIEND